MPNVRAHSRACSLAVTGTNIDMEYVPYCAVAIGEIASSLNTQTTLTQTLTPHSGMDQAPFTRTSTPDFNPVRQAENRPLLAIICDLNMATHDPEGWVLPKVIITHIRAKSFVAADSQEAVGSGPLPSCRPLDKWNRGASVLDDDNCLGGSDVEEEHLRAFLITY